MSKSLGLLALKALLLLGISAFAAGYLNCFLLGLPFFIWAMAEWGRFLVRYARQLRIRRQNEGWIGPKSAETRTHHSKSSGR